MIRRKKYVTETCHTCRRPGWRYEKHYSLMTEEEQHKLFGDRLASSIADIKGAPKEAEKCWAGGGAEIGACCTEAVALAKKMDKPVAFEFNGKTVVAYKDSDANKLYRKWWKDVYNKTPEESYAER